MNTLQNEKGSIAIILIAVISIILGLAVFAVDLSNIFLTKSKVKLISDLGALSGAAELQVTKDEDKALALAKSVTESNLATTKGSAWKGATNSVKSKISWSGSRGVINVSYEYQNYKWLSGILGQVAGSNTNHDSFAAIDMGEPPDAQPLHVILMSDIGLNICVSSTKIKNCPKDPGSSFAKALLEKLDAKDYLTWIPYDKLAKVFFQKLPMTDSNKALVLAHLERLNEEVWLSRTHDNPLTPYGGDLREHSSAMTAARAILSKTPQTENEAIVFTTTARNYDFDYLFKSVYSYPFVPNPGIDNFYIVNKSEATALKTACGVREIPNVYANPHLLFRPRSIEDYWMVMEPGTGEELTNKIIRDLQMERDLKVYTIPINPVNPNFELTNKPLLNEGYLFDFLVNLAGDNRYLKSKVKSKFKCAQDRPAEKGGLFLKYQANESLRAAEMAYHARYADSLKGADGYLFRPKLFELAG